MPYTPPHALTATPTVERSGGNPAELVPPLSILQSQWPPGALPCLVDLLPSCDCREPWETREGKPPPTSVLFSTTSVAWWPQHRANHVLLTQVEFGLSRLYHNWPVCVWASCLSHQQNEHNTSHGVVEGVRRFDGVSYVKHGAWPLQGLLSFPNAWEDDCQGHGGGGGVSLAGGEHCHIPRGETEQEGLQELWPAGSGGGPAVFPEAPEPADTWSGSRLINAQLGPLRLCQATMGED